MNLNKIFLTLSVVAGLMLIGGCSSKNAETTNSAPGAPAGPQPGAGGNGARSNNGVQ